jgi:hypothetical protein
MTKYKWSLLGLIVSTILFLLLLISPLTIFINSVIIPAEKMPVEILKLSNQQISLKDLAEGKNPFIKSDEAEKAYKEWYKNVPKKFNKSALGKFGQSFYHWNLFWIPIIIFSFMAFNYKKISK